MVTVGETVEAVSTLLSSKLTLKVVPAGTSAKFLINTIYPPAVNSQKIPLPSKAVAVVVISQ